MHTTLQRLNGVFSFMTSVVFVLAACIAITGLVLPSTPSAHLTVSNWRVYVLNSAQTNCRKSGRAPRGSQNPIDYAFINFDLESGISPRKQYTYIPDLSSLFNWNVKQVFAYIVAEYTTPRYVCSHSPHS